MQTALRNARGRTVGEAMHEAAIISPDTSIMSAANSIVRATSAIASHVTSAAGDMLLSAVYRAASYTSAFHRLRALSMACRTVVSMLLQNYVPRS